MSVLSNLDVDMTNLHAAGTISMMEAAIEGLTRPDGTRPLLIAVTQLTSTDQERMENDLLIKEPIDKVVMHYASNAAKAIPIIPAGGIILPIVLAWASTLAARWGGKPERIMAGMVNTPVVATLPGPEPDSEPI